jgi:alkylation response protein AidB-like acyl-CoA dehydrogenase
MNFSLTPDQQARLDQARRFADETLRPIAASVDAGQPLPPAAQAAFDAQAGGVFGAGARSAALTLEALAEASASGALVIGLAGAGVAPSGAGDDLPGLRGAGPWLRGAGALPPGPVRVRCSLVLAAVSVGVAHAAVAEAVSVLKQSGQRPGGDEPTPHWVLADAATEADGASLLLVKAAGSVEAAATSAEGDIALARVYAGEVAQRAVDAALRVAGPASFGQGGLIERLLRDSRSLAMASVPIEQERMTAAAGVLPG